MSDYKSFTPKYVKDVPLDKFLKNNEHVANDIDLKKVHEHYNPKPVKAEDKK